MDTYNLARFVSAQAGSYSQVVRELRDGQKRTHWMWFVFPQIDGLGMSPTSRHYAIKNLEEAWEYLRHPILGPRLIECTKIVNSHEGLTARSIFGTPDDLKFHSSMTLFELVAEPESEFAIALDTFFEGQRDVKTLELVGIKPQGGS